MVRNFLLCASLLILSVLTAAPAFAQECGNAMVAFAQHESLHEMVRKLAYCALFAPAFSFSLLLACNKRSLQAARTGCCVMQVTKELNRLRRGAWALSAVPIILFGLGYYLVGGWTCGEFDCMFNTYERARHLCPLLGAIAGSLSLYLCATKSGARIGGYKQLARWLAQSGAKAATVGFVAYCSALFIVNHFL